MVRELKLAPRNPEEARFRCRGGRRNNRLDEQSALLLLYATCRRMVHRFPPVLTPGTRSTAALNAGLPHAAGF